MFEAIFLDYWWAWAILALILLGYRGRPKKEEPVPVIGRRAATGYSDTYVHRAKPSRVPHVPADRRDEEPEEDSVLDIIEELIPERDEAEDRGRQDERRRRDSGGDDGLSTLHLQTMDTGGARRASVDTDDRSYGRSHRDDIPAGRDADPSPSDDGGDGGGD